MKCCKGMGESKSCCKDGAAAHEKGCMEGCTHGCATKEDCMKKCGEACAKSH